MNVLVVGSSVIDLFLEIKDKSKIINGEGTVSLRLGDKIPIDLNKLTIGGDGANISVGLQRLGIDASFYTFLGHDLFSKEIEEALAKEGVKLIVQREGQTSFLSLILNFDKDRVIFTNREERNNDFNYNDPAPGFLYLASVGDKWEDVYRKALLFTKENNIPLGFTPGGPQLEKPFELLTEILKSSKTVFLNKDEAEKILKFHNIEYKNDIKDILSKLKSLGMEVLSITNGLLGAYCLDKNGDFYSIKPFGNNLVDRVGAGDAYTSGFLSGYLSGLDTAGCMGRGAFNASSVVQKTGAQEGLLRKEEMDKMEEENGEFHAKII